MLRCPHHARLATARWVLAAVFRNARPCQPAVVLRRPSLFSKREEGRVAMSRKGSWVSAAVVLALAPTSGCTGQVVDRAGSDTLVLTLGTSDGLVQVSDRSYGPVSFVKAIESVSGGRLRVRVVTDVGNGAADAETQLVKDLVAGELDLGYPATRAYAAAGIRGLEPFDAPFVLANHQAVAEAVTGDAGRLALAALKGKGLVGLALGDGGLRRPMSVKGALVTTGAWQGVRFRVYNSPTQAAAVTALGARPVDATQAWEAMMARGDLDGAEIGLEAPDSLSPNIPDLHMALNIVLWPKVSTFVANERRFLALSAEQQTWIRQAADRARIASLGGPWDDTEIVAAQCRRGMVFQSATAPQLAELRDAVEGVVRNLRSDQHTAALMHAVDVAAARHPDPKDPPVAENCAASVQSAVSELRGKPPSTLPDGVYRTEIPISAVAAAGLNNSPGWSGVWTLRVTHAEYALYCKPLDQPGRDCGAEQSDAALEGGRLVGASHDVSFVSDPAAAARLTGCHPPTTAGTGTCPGVLPTYSSSWRVVDNELWFGRAGAAPTSHLDIRPWVKIG